MSFFFTFFCVMIPCCCVVYILAGNSSFGLHHILLALDPFIGDNPLYYQFISQRTSMKSFIFFIIIACTLALAAAFAASNDQLVDFNYLIALDSFKLSSLLIGAFVSGVVVAGVCMSLFMMKLRLSISKFKRKSKRQVAELERLRAAEIKG